MSTTSRPTEYRPAVWLLALGGLFFFVLRSTDWFRSVPGDLGDARFNSVILEHLFQRATGDARSLWSPPFFYPATGVLAFSDNHFGSGIVYIVLRWLGLGRELAFDGWFAIGCLLNFAAMHAAMRKLDFSSFASAVAAFIFAFSLPAFAQETHAQLTYRFAVPLAWLALVQFARERRWVRLAQLAGWGSLQFYFSIYLGVFTAYLIAASAVTMLLPGLRPVRSRRNGARRDAPAPALLVILVCAIATGYLLFKYQTISKIYGFVRSPVDVLTMLPWPQSYLLADHSTLYRWIGERIGAVPMRHEHQMFMGVAPIVLALCGLAGSRGDAFSPRRQLAWLCLITLALLVAATLQLNGRSLYELAMRLPGVSSIRAVSRIVLVMALPVAVMTAAGVEKLEHDLAPRWMLSALIVTALSAETLSYQPTRTPIETWRERLAPIAAAAAHSTIRADSVLYVTGRSGEPFYMTELDGMLMAQDLKIPTLNGYSGNAPPGYLHPEPCVSPAVRIHAIARPLLARQGMSPESLIARTIWLPGETCPIRNLPTGIAMKPIPEETARSIRLEATLADEDPRGLALVVRIRNEGKEILHGLSGIGEPLRLSWRFVPQAVDSSLPEPAWDARHDLNVSIAPGETEQVSLTIPPPQTSGLYELQFTLVAEGYKWLHDLGMPIGSAQVSVGGEDAKVRH